MEKEAITKGVGASMSARFCCLPFPKPDTTPPVTQTYFIFLLAPLALPPPLPLLVLLLPRPLSMTLLGCCVGGCGGAGGWAENGLENSGGGGKACGLLGCCRGFCGLDASLAPRQRKQ